MKATNRSSLSIREFTLVQTAIVLMVAALFTGGALVAEELSKMYAIHEQVSQIAAFDQAVANFNSKYEGLPGDLLHVSAIRMGLPTGNGTPAHGDGDGNISPCTLGWQPHLGCETALFWLHLSAAGMIKGNFSEDGRLSDDRLEEIQEMDSYLPESPLEAGVYITVWNTNESQPSPEPRLPYGNYYEISGIDGISNGQMVDNPQALTPEQSYAIDAKMDDGKPFSGRVMVNGAADWPNDAWGTYAKPGGFNCVFTDKTYNTAYLATHTQLCHLAVRL